MPVSIAAIKITQKQANVNDEAYHAILMEIAGATSSKELTPVQRVAVYARLKEIEKQTATPLVRKLFGLFYHTTHRQPVKNPTAWLIGFIQKANKLPDPPKSINAVAPAHLQKAIEALKMRH